MKEYFKNEILQVIEEEYIGHNYTTIDYRYNFLGKEGRYCTNEDGIKDFIQKRLSAYNLVPNRCTIIPENLIGLFRGMFVGGILGDCIYTVYGIVRDRNGLNGYSCSIYFLPTEEVLKSIMNYSSVFGEFDKKEKNFEINIK